MTGRAVVRAGRDAWVDPTRPSKNLSATVQSQIGGDATYAPGAAQYTGAYTYMFFHNPAPRGATILTATLRFYTAGAWGTSGTTDVLVQRVAQSVKFAQLNWNNRPRRTGGTVTATAAANAGNFLWEINVQPHLQTISNGAPNFGWWIASPSGTRRHLWAFDAGHHQPTLTVEWSDAPQTPTNLIPSGAQVVATPTPLLQWDYVDLAGNTDLAAFQVQIDDNASWSGAINWDSGIIAADEPELNLTAVPAPGPAYPGMQDGMSRYWRVRVQDGAGLWSLWSARADGVGARMQYQSKGDLQLLTPIGGTVTDVTPVVAWTFSGASPATALRFGAWAPGWWDRWIADTPQARAAQHQASPFHALEVALGRGEFEIEHFYYGWGGPDPNETTFNRPRALAALERGARPMVTWEPWDYTAGLNQTGNLANILTNIANGVWDSYIDQEATIMRNLGGEVWLRWGHEMNVVNVYPWGKLDPPGNFTAWAAAYVTAYRRIVDRFRAVGATNVKHIWCPNEHPDASAPNPSFAAMYPGDSYVDFVGFDSYNWGSGDPSGWRTPTQVLDRTYRLLTEGPAGGMTTTRPVIICEIGTEGTSSQRVSWIGQLGSYLNGLTRLYALVWFSENVAGHGDWRLDYDPATLAAARAVFPAPGTTARALGSWRILIVDPDDPTHEYWHSGRLLGSRAATSTANRYEWTLPDHVLTKWGRRYRLILDAWDDLDRVSIPGAPAWVRATHDFTLTAGPPAPPTNLTAWSDADGKPYLHLQWQRANTPDQWRIWRDDTRIAILDGLAPMTSTPGRYEWMDRDSRQNYYQTWTVQAVENGVGSPHSPAWSGRIANDHAWLIDWETDRLVAILDPDISFDAPEIAATYEPLGAEKVVRVVQAQRGQEGTVSGRIIGFGNTSGHDYEDNFLWFRANRAAKSRTCRLMVGNRTWRVLLGDMVLSPLRMYDPESAGGRQSISACSFSFWSVDGPDEPT